jgi:hypothetical protein
MLKSQCSAQDSIGQDAASVEMLMLACCHGSREPGMADDAELGLGSNSNNHGRQPAPQNDRERFELLGIITSL